jgi:hypothetical protein
VRVSSQVPHAPDSCNSAVAANGASPHSTVPKKPTPRHCGRVWSVVSGKHLLTHHTVPISFAAHPAAHIHCHNQNLGSGKGVRSQLCEAPKGPFRQLTPDPFSRPTPKSNGDKALAEGRLPTKGQPRAEKPKYDRHRPRHYSQKMNKGHEVDIYRIATRGGTWLKKVDCTLNFGVPNATGTLLRSGRQIAIPAQGDAGEFGQLLSYTGDSLLVVAG